MSHTSHRAAHRASRRCVYIRSFTQLSCYSLSSSKYDEDGKTSQSYDEDQAKRWQVKKDGGQFDQFTGATITPRAVVGSVARTLAYVEANQHQLFNTPSNCRAAAPTGGQH